MAPNSGDIGSLSTHHQLQIAEAKVVFQWCVDQGLRARGYECPKCERQMVLRPMRDISDGFNWVCRLLSHFFSRGEKKCERMFLVWRFLLILALKIRCRPRHLTTVSPKIALVLLVSIVTGRYYNLS
ncbi:hypothetical protein AVEN_82537-1 [Araneus ventricosus]|uniref:Uncharacterized protein n=1 Tax=Araneus ventricosus TaxID=182803 RepID=A0A4Y2GQ12_ARAVE|nr:hypothetical protein AVEN_82537-1 [Araneus ventricosus]